MKSEKDVQEEAFRRQLDLARDLELPYIIHCRDADDDLVTILTDHGYAHGVVHCFGGTPDHARALLDLGMHLSFCGNITYKSAESLREAARVVPVDRLLLETDCPFLAPKPKRGKRNEPAFVAHTARFIAELKGVSFEELTETATHTTRELFSL